MQYQREIDGVLNGLMFLGSLFRNREVRWFLALILSLIVVGIAADLRASYYPLAPWEALSIVDLIRFVFINIVLVAQLWLTFKIVAHEINPEKFY